MKRVLTALGLVVAVIGTLCTGANTVKATTFPAETATAFCPAGYGDIATGVRTGVDGDGAPVYAYSGAGLAGLANFDIAGPQGHDGIFYTATEMHTRVGVNGNWGITKWEVKLRGGTIYDIEDYKAAGGDKAVSEAATNVFGTGDDIARVRACVHQFD